MSNSSMGAGRHTSFLSFYLQLSLGVKILIWMGIGVLVGILFGEQATYLKPIGDLFIKLLLMAAIPLVFCNLVAGITSLSSIAILGRLGLFTFSYYLLTTGMSLTLGLTMTHLFNPGEGMQMSEKLSSEPGQAQFGDIPDVSQVLLDLFPQNVFQAFAEGHVGQIVVFAIFFGITTLLMPTEQKDKIQDQFALAADLFRRLVGVVLYFAPFGVGALAASTVGEYGDQIFGPLAKFISTVWTAQLLMMLFYLFLLLLLTNRSPVHWLKTTWQLYATTTATCSSLASLVVAMDIAKNKLRLKQKVFTFTLPLGAQLNKDGTAIMLAAVFLFTAQAVGVEFTLTEQITVVLVGLLLSEGSGGIPGGGLVIALIFVEAFHLPVEVAGIVAGIYRLIDMGSTTTNVMGDLIWSTILSDREERKEHSNI